MNWRDAVVITVIILIMLLLIGMALDVPLDHLLSWRLLTLILAFISMILTLTISPVLSPTNKIEYQINTMLYTSAVVLEIISIIFNNKTVFIAFSINLIALWGFTTYYHIKSHSLHY